MILFCFIFLYTKPSISLTFLFILHTVKLLYYAVIKRGQIIPDGMGKYSLKDDESRPNYGKNVAFQVNRQLFAH